MLPVKIPYTKKPYDKYTKIKDNASNNKTFFTPILSISFPMNGIKNIPINDPIKVIIAIVSAPLLSSSINTHGPYTSMICF